MRRDRERFDDSTLPLVCGQRGRHSLSPKPVSLANAQALSTRVRLPPLTTTSADMLSVTHSRGTPPSLMIVRNMHLTGSSAVRVFERMNRCLRE